MCETSKKGWLMRPQTTSSKKLFNPTAKLYIKLSSSIRSVSAKLSTVIGTSTLKLTKILWLSSTSFLSSIQTRFKCLKVTNFCSQSYRKYRESFNKVMAISLTLRWRVRLEIRSRLLILWWLSTHNQSMISCAQTLKFKGTKAATNESFFQM